jgi:hypothetical protein
VVVSHIACILVSSAFFLGGHMGMCTPKHFVNLMGESKNFKLLEILEVIVSCVI